MYKQYNKISRQANNKAIEKYGQFPFSRDIYGNIIRDLYRRNAGLVVFNVLTPDRDRMGRDNDYVQALRQNPTILPNIGSTVTRNQPRAPGSVIVGPYGVESFITYPGIIANQPAIEQAAAGVGITLTAAEAVIMNDLSFVPSDHAQAEDRSYRYGQKSNVSVYYPIFENTIEGVIYDILNKKKNIFETVMGDNVGKAEIVQEIMNQIFGKR